MNSGTPYDTAPQLTRPAAAEYIALEMSRLARIASANDFALLPYLIDMAVLEAWREASEPERGARSNWTAHGGRAGEQAAD